MRYITLPASMSIEEYRNILYEHYIEVLKDIGINIDSVHGLEFEKNSWIRQDKDDPRLVT